MVPRRIVVVWICVVCLFTLLTGVTRAANETDRDTPQVAAIRSIHSALLKGDHAAIYVDWCHPHLQKQLDENEFVKGMESDFGKAVTQLFTDVLKAVDEKAGPDEVLAQPQEEEDQYEFILVPLEKQGRGRPRGVLWHLELQLHKGKWKLMDVD